MDRRGLSTALRFAVSMALLVGMQPPLRASTRASNFSVNATVTGYCTVATTPVAFGAYDPVVSNATTARDSTGSVVVACTQGEATTIGIGPGGNALAGARRMAFGTGNFLAYELYQEAGRTTVWGSTGSQLLTPASAPSYEPRTFTVYGRVPAGQDVPAGSFADSAVVTVTF